MKYRNSFAGTLLAIGLAFSCVAFFGCPKKAAGPEQRQAAKPPAPVRVAAAEKSNIPVIIESFGTAEPLSTIELKAQVSGEIVSIAFKEGDFVTKGQELFQIDPRPYQVALAQAEANLARAEADLGESKSMASRDQIQLSNAQTEAARNKTLLERGMVTQEEYDTARTASESLRASVGASEASVRASQEAIRAAKAQIDAARLSLSFCTITAPIEGRTGSVMIHPGNLVRANDAQPMVIITQTKPIYVSFTVPEKHLPAIRERFATTPLEVTAALHPKGENSVKGTLSFFDNSVDSATSTIRLKATFPNDDEQLWPGQYVEVGLVLDTLAEVVTVPEMAVQSGQLGPYVYVLGAENTAEFRQVRTGPTFEKRTVIEEGVAAGETVVTEGHLRMAPDVAVRVIDEKEGAKETAS